MPDDDERRHGGVTVLGTHVPRQWVADHAASPSRRASRQTHGSSPLLCQDAVGSGVLGWVVTGPGSDFSEELV